MSKTINVRVTRAKLLGALKRALAEKQKEAKEHASAVKAKEVAMADIKKQIASLIKAGKMTPKEVSFPYSYRYNQDETKEVTVTFSHKIAIPKLDTNYSEHTNGSAIEELENAIRILELSDEDFVKTSSYGSVAKYL